jgi:hypothetical protein
MHVLKSCCCRCRCYCCPCHRWYGCCLQVKPEKPTETKVSLHHMYIRYLLPTGSVRTHCKAAVWQQLLCCHCVEPEQLGLRLPLPVKHCSTSSCHSRSCKRNSCPPTWSCSCYHAQQQLLSTAAAQDPPPVLYQQCSTELKRTGLLCCIVCCSLSFCCIRRLLMPPPPPSRG